MDGVRVNAPTFDLMNGTSEMARGLLASGQDTRDLRTAGMATTNDRSIVLDLMTRDWETNSLISHALVRIGDGTYDRCEACDERISAERLAALPWARFCISCQDRIDDAASTGVRWDAAA